jgi:branched-chain amino acid aminotransferase
MAATFWLDGTWTDQPPRLIGPQDHAFWLASVTFDGARAFRRRAPDLDLHCRRAVASATALGLTPGLAAEEIERLAVEGVRRFAPDAELYIKPVFYAAGSGHHVDGTETRFVLHLFEAPLPGPAGFSASLSPYRRPLPESAPTDAKAACLYPNSDRATNEARHRGFDAAVMLDPWDNVAEFAFANLMIARDGRVLTPASNGTFLAGITRRRVLALLNEAGIEAVEATLSTADLHVADEIFSTGNFGKVMPCNRFETRALNVGPIGEAARRLYFEWAQTCPEL